MKYLAPLLLLAGCGPADGYEYDRAEFDRRQVTVSVVTHPTVADLRSEADRMGVVPEHGDLMAFGLVKANEPACTIHIVEPAEQYAPEWIGHELTHCIRGRWHP